MKDKSRDLLGGTFLSVKMGPPSDCCHGDSRNNVGPAQERTAEVLTEKESDVKNCL